MATVIRTCAGNVSVESCDYTVAVGSSVWKQTQYIIGVGASSLYGYTRDRWYLIATCDEDHEMH